MGILHGLSSNDLLKFAHTSLRGTTTVVVVKLLRCSDSIFNIHLLQFSVLELLA